MTTAKIDNKKIAEHAKANRWTPATIAVETGLSYPTVLSVFKGTNTPSATNLKAICDTIGLSVEEVFITEPTEAAA